MPGTRGRCQARQAQAQAQAQALGRPAGAVAPLARRAQRGEAGRSEDRDAATPRHRDTAAACAERRNSRRCPRWWAVLSPWCACAARVRTVWHGGHPAWHALPRLCPGPAKGPSSARPAPRPVLGVPASDVRHSPPAPAAPTSHASRMPVVGWAPPTAADDTAISANSDPNSHGNVPSRLARLRPDWRHQEALARCECAGSHGRADKEGFRYMYLLAPFWACLSSILLRARTILFGCLRRKLFSFPIRCRVYGAVLSLTLSSVLQPLALQLFSSSALHLLRHADIL